jgi:DNA polymerase-3 subunit epsilon
MRQVILDTETTGLEPAEGHRIIEIGCVEIKNRRRSDRVFHQYLNPGRDIEDGAYDVHGIRNEFLTDKPGFKEIARDLIDFIRDSEVIIHNAPFDEAFIDAELKLLGPEWGRLRDHCRVTDTLAMARELHPGQKNSLDALCSRYNIDNSQRNLHGALLDAQILLDVYLAMTGGQATLSLEEEVVAEGGVVKHKLLNTNRAPLRLIRPTAAELAAHQERLAAIDKESDGKCVWLLKSEE